MGGYEIAELILFLISQGFRADALRKEVADAKAAGKTERELGELLQGMADKSIADAQGQIDAPGG